MKKITGLILYFILFPIATFADNTPSESTTDNSYIHRLSKANDLIMHCLPVLVDNISTGMVQQDQLQAQEKEKFKEKFIEKFTEAPFVVVTLSKYFSAEEMEVVSNICGDKAVQEVFAKVIKLSTNPDRKSPFYQDFEMLGKHIESSVSEIRQEFDAR